MPASGLADDEPRRHDALDRLGLLGDAVDDSFDRLARIAAAATGAPIALITFLGRERQSLAARVGWSTRSMPIADAFCRFAVDRSGLLEIVDTQRDDRVRETRLVTGPEAIRFYAGHPVRFEGIVLGTVCVLDRRPRTLSAAERAVLADLAAMASDLLRQRNDRRLRIERENQNAALRAALQRSESMLSAAQRVARLGSWELQPASGEALFSAETLRLLQQSALPLLFDDFVGRLRHADGRPFAPALGEAVSEDLLLATADGGERWVRWVSRPVRRPSAGGPPVESVVGTLQDISAAKEAERRLRTVENRFRLLWSTTTDVVVMMGHDNRIRFVNPAVRELLGHDPDTLVGEDLAILQPEHLREAHRRGFARYLRSGVRRLDWRATEALALHRDGREIPVEISFADMDLDGERMFAACIRDITARKEQAHALQQAQKLEAIGALAGGVAHDVNNVLAGMLGNVRFALDAVGEAHPAHAHLRQIDKGGRRGRDLVDRILSFAQRRPQALQPCELNALVEDGVGLLRSALPAAARLSLALAPGPLGIHADPTQMTQVVLNLCTNAVQSLVDGCGEVEVGTAAVELGADDARRAQLEPGRYVHLWVRDSGDGMSESTLARIFEPFFTTKSARAGTGLGLAVVHGVVGAHGGGLRVDSEPGSGSCFHVYLRPARPPVQADAVPPPVPRPQTPGRGERVLYVDDDEVMLTMVEQLLQRLGYRATTAGSAAAALAAIDAAPDGFAAVVSDFNMPGGSGLQLAAALAALRPGLPVLLGSGNVSDELAGEAERLGIRALLRKQYLIDELGDALAAALAPPPATP